MSQELSAGRKEHWRGLLEEHRDSGLTVSAFCRQRELNQSSFYRWRKILEQSVSSPDSKAQVSESLAKFVPVSLGDTSCSRSQRVPAPVPSALDCYETSSLTARSFRISLPNGIRVDVPVDFNAQALHDLLQTVQDIILSPSK